MPDPTEQVEGDPMDHDYSTPEGVQAALDELRASVRDDEGAHVLEDRLYKGVLAEIANGNPAAARLARIALEARDLDFSRWYA